MDTQQSPTLAECLVAFGQRFSRHHGHDAQCRRLLASYTDSSYDNTVRLWIREKDQKLPQGERFYRTLTFFVFAGYSVREFEVMAKYLQPAALLLGAGLVSPAELAREFGYGEKRRATTTLYATLHRSPHLSQDKIDHLKEFLGENEQLLKEARAEFEKTHAAVLLSDAAPKLKRPTVATKPSPNAAAATLPMPNTSSASIGMSRDEEQAVSPTPEVVSSVPSTPAQLPDAVAEAAVESLAHHIRAMLPLARFVESDAVSKEMRAKLRDLSGKGRAHGTTGLFELSNILQRLKENDNGTLAELVQLLNLLCSERNRNDERGK